MIVKTTCSLHMQHHPSPKCFIALKKEGYLSLEQHKTLFSNKYAAFLVLYRKSREDLLNRGWFLIQVLKSSSKDQSYLSYKTIHQLDFTTFVIFLSP